MGRFKRGDLVKHAMSNLTWRVMYEDRQGIYCLEHPTDGTTRMFSPYYLKLSQTEKENVMALYEWKDENKNTVYGTKLATDSSGNWVMEVKGTGNVVSVPKGSVEKVMPYTVSVRFSTTEKTYAYLSEAGKVDKGDFVLTNAPSGFAIVQVVAVDTKSASATKELEVLKKL